MIDTNVYLEINQGRVNGKTPVIIFGRNPNIEKAPTPPEDLISQGGQYEGFLATDAQILDLVSTQPSDNASGTGAQDVLIFGLDNNFDPISERKALNGTTVVKTTNAYRRINTMYIDNVGSNERNSGVVSASQETSGHKMSEISVDAGIAHQAIYTIPDKKVMICQDLNIILNDSIGALGIDKAEGLVTIEVREGQNKSWRQYYITGISQVGGPYDLDITITRALKPKTDIRVRVITVPEEDIDVSARLTGVLVDLSTVTFPQEPA